ncbi:hypothetical protein FPOA_05699 [Fusarium poae]|uniref:F-box domain-containing protein n=1 Tax=Fusarium poae TaxID=36050 RepID=A0A1B8AXM8_FUSPO|nr:hypothetical protein FPOA_05699 [Fusarium poae]
MANITSLPDEVLEHIFIYVTDRQYDDIFEVCLVNKRFCEIATPLRVRHWSDCGLFSIHGTPPSHTTISRLALELLRQPELRLQVRSLNFDWIRRDEGKETPRHLIRPENLELLAKAAKETLPDLASSTDLCEKICQGWDDGIAVLVLAWTTNLSSLGLTIPSYTQSKDDDDYRLLVLYFTKQLALRFDCHDPKTASPLPLEKLDTLDFRHWDVDGEIHVKHLSPFLHFPNLKNLNTSFIGDNQGRDLSYIVVSTDNNHLMPFPERTSSLESIYMDEPKLSNSGIRSLLHACKNLKVFSMDASEIGTRSSTMLVRSLVEHSSTLEEVRLFIQDGEDDRQWIPDSADGHDLPECYRKLKKLKRVGIPMQHLYHRDDANTLTTAKLNLGRLPESLEHLVVFHQKLHFARVQMEYFLEELSGEILETFESDRHQALVDMRRLLEETGPRGRLKNLKTVDFSDALLDDPMVDEIRKVKDLAKERGVEFILGKIKR